MRIVRTRMKPLSEYAAQFYHGYVKGFKVKYTLVDTLGYHTQGVLPAFFGNEDSAYQALQKEEQWIEKSVKCGWYADYTLTLVGYTESEAFEFARHTRYVKYPPKY